MNFLKSLFLAVILSASAVYGQNITFTGAGTGGITYTGTNGVTVSGSAIGIGDSSNPATSLFINRGAVAAEEYELTGRAGVGIPVPYFTPTTNNTVLAFDIFPKGSPSSFSNATGNVWMDICSTDIAADGTNYECLRLGKFPTGVANGICHISAAAGGTGTVRNLALQALGGSLEVGDLNIAPTTHFGVHANINGGEVSCVYNPNAGAAAYASIEARNDATKNGGTCILTTGTGWTTNGAYSQDTGIVESGSNLSGGMSVIARAGNMRFYTGGIADATNLRLTISSTAATFTTDVVAGTVGNGIQIKEGTNATMGVATLVGGTVTVSTTKALTNSRIQLTVNSLGTVLIPRAVGVTARVNATSFTITSEDAIDTSTVAWVILNPAP